VNQLGQAIGRRDLWQGSKDGFGELLDQPAPVDRGGLIDGLTQGFTGIGVHHLIKLGHLRRDRGPSPTESETSNPRAGTAEKHCRNPARSTS
jgi:hypothetical protein